MRSDWRRTCTAAALMAAAVAFACGGPPPADPALQDSVARARQDSINRAQPGYVVDSILPVEEELRRFRSGLPVVTSLEGGATSREKLLSLFLRAVEEADTAALVRLAISRSEFAYLVYPESPYTSPPYRQAPGLVWMRYSGASGTGLARLLGRWAGVRLGGRASASCSGSPVQEGNNRIWRDCVVRVVTGADTVASRLVGAVIERQGKYKILSYANDL